MRKIVITGACGMIGHGFNEKYKDKVILNVDKRPGYLPNLLVLDLANLDSKSSAFNMLSSKIHECDVVVHLAANSRVHASHVNPYLAQENFNSAFNVLEICRKANKPMVFASSREVFGDCWVAAEKTPHHYLSPYAVTKGLMEKMLQVYSEIYGYNSLIFRYSNVYGRHDFQDRLIPNWIKQMKEGKDVTLWGSEKTFNFTYLDDCIEVSSMIIEWGGRGVYNIAGEKEKCKNIFGYLKEILGSESNLIFERNRPGEPNYGDIHSVMYTWPFISTKEGLKKTCEWYLKDERYKKVKGGLYEN